MREARRGALWALLLCAAAFGQQLEQEVTPAFQETAQNPGSSMANATLVLAGGAPQFTLASDASCASADGSDSGAAAAAGAACTPEQWLAVALRDVYEVDTSDRVVQERSAAAVLDLAAGVEWEAGDELLGSPEVPAFQGTLRLPFKQQLPACPGGSNAPEVPPDGGLTLRVQLFGGLTNVTYVDEVLELLPGNVKWSVLVDGWPWCDAANKLVLAFGLLPANASTDTTDGLVVESGAEVQERLEKQQDLLTGAADPDAVPMPDSGSGGNASAAAPPPDPAAAGAAGRRRLMAFRAGGFKSSGRAATKPTSKPPVVSSGSSSGSSKPVSVTPSSSGKPYRPYFPAGGASRPRFPTTAAALGTLPFAATQRPYLASRYFYNRPVYGFGRRPFLPYSTFLFFPLLFGASRTGTQYAVAPSVDMQQAVLLDNTTTAIARVEVPPAEPSGVQPVLVSLPHFNETAQYDSIATISESDLAVTDGLEEAIAEVMAWNDTVTASSSSGSHTLQVQTAAAVGLAAAAAGVLLLI